MWSFLKIVAIVALVLPSGSALARTGDCRQEALDQLRAASPGGFAVYSQISQPDFFARWIDCHDAQYDLSTAVHESTHFITNETDAFPLVGGGAIERPHEVSDFFPPSRIAARFERDDFASIYLRGGKASSSSDFLYLLDELNAYSHDLATAVDLKHLSTADEIVDHRDGLAALMAFLAIYVETAKESEPTTWQGLLEPRVARTVTALWTRAERVMVSSCGIPRFGSTDKAYISRFCAPRAQEALEPILGRPPLCPSACLRPTSDAEPIGEDGVAQSPSRLTMREETLDETHAADRPRHPFNIKVGAHRHRLHAEDLK